MSRDIRGPGSLRASGGRACPRSAEGSADAITWAVERAQALGGRSARRRIITSRIPWLQLPAASGRAHDDLDRDREDDQVSEHLPGDHEPRHLALGRDVGRACGPGPALPVTVTHRYQPPEHQPATRIQPPDDM